MSSFLVVAFVAGTALFAAKWVIMSLIMKIFPRCLRNWIYRTPLALIALDFGFGGLAAPVATMAGGTIAMLTMITFGTWSATFIVGHILTSKGKRWWHTNVEGAW